MDNFDYKIKEILSKDIDLPYKYQNIVRTTLKNKKNIKFQNYRFFKIVATACACIIITTSVVFAKNISNFIKNIFNNNSEGIKTAIENNYILQPNMEYIESNGTEVKINNLLMDDMNLSFSINIKYKDIIKVNEISKAYLPDMIIVDDKNKIIYCQDEDTFYNYCKDNKLDFKYKEFNENNINSSSNYFIKYRNYEDNSMEIVYNLFSNKFPNSKQLKIYFNKIEMEKNEDEKNKIAMTGNWKLDIEIPEKFYNRQAIVYTVNNCSNTKINVTEAIVYNTGMKLSLNIQENLIYDINDDNETIQRKISEKVEALRNKAIQDSANGDFNSINPFKGVPYVETENGKRYYPSENSSEDSGYADDYKTGLITYWQTFNLTKYDTTENLKVYLNYNGEDIFIELER